jgi:hypothetical protein
LFQFSAVIPAYASGDLREDNTSGGEEEIDGGEGGG